jgi:hypothetical protein
MDEKEFVYLRVRKNNKNPKQQPMSNDTMNPVFADVKQAIADFGMNKKQAIIALHNGGLTRDQIKSEMEVLFGPKDRHAFIYKTLKAYLGDEFVLAKRGRPAKDKDAPVQIEIEFPAE